MALFQIKHRVTASVLFELECDSLKLCVSAAVVSGADLSGAYLRGADLRGADLRGADLRGADLSGASLIDAGQDQRGYRFIGWLHDGTIRIGAGCHDFTLAEATAHWASAHASDPVLHAECLAKVALIETVAMARGWIEAKQEAAA